MPEQVIFSIDPGEHIGFAVSDGTNVLDAGVIVGMTESERFGTLQEKLLHFRPHLILIENSYKYKKKVHHLLKQLPESERPAILLRDANQVQFRLFGKPCGKYGKDKTLHRQMRMGLVRRYFGGAYEVHANDALLMIIDWQRDKTCSLPQS